ncbi:hypothetical protein [Sporosarcina highlanderae]|uniref:Uncharacterized protein n=1 Tax=Sporosarcina highlanderae TaxID=3035916 RepID=A0ABT8JPV4_9BACL|nr:hypothetical protein [Sporosarcina highlanderae]MDN4607176.1 hypothetical protein [Sporosarcina highlanderae]
MHSVFFYTYLGVFETYLGMFERRLTTIDAAGGLDGILRDDPKMQELAASAFHENKERLEALADVKDDIIIEIRERFYDFEELEQRAHKQAAAVESLENEIDELKKFVPSVDFTPKAKYRHKGATVPRSINLLFSDVRKHWKT